MWNKLAIIFIQMLERNSIVFDYQMEKDFGTPLQGKKLRAILRPKSKM